MATARAWPVAGGPADGAEVRSSEVFVWLDDAGRMVGEGDGALYQREGGGFVFKGFCLSRCGGCGGFVDREAGASCPLCGAGLR